MDEKTEAPEGWPVGGPTAVGGRTELPTKVSKWWSHFLSVTLLRCFPGLTPGYGCRFRDPEA